jgi:hypothetical protein
VIVARDEAELRQALYQVIKKMVEDGELVPVYDGDQLVDIRVVVPV